MGYGDVLYENNFENGNLNDWVTPWPGLGNWTIVDGTLQSSTGPQYIALQAFFPLPDYPFVVEFDTKTIVDGLHPTCVMGFYLPWANHYRPGNFEVWNNWMRLTDIGDCVEYKQTLAMPGADPSVWHHFKIIRGEDQYAVYYDDVLIHEGAIDPTCINSVLNKNFGFGACEGSTIQIDNLVIYTPGLTLEERIEALESQVESLQGQYNSLMQQLGDCPTTKQCFPDE